MKQKWLLALLPLGVGVILIVLLENTSLPNPALTLQSDLGTGLGLAGLLVSLLLIARLSLNNWVDKIQAHHTQQIQNQMANERRQFLQRLDHELKNPLTAIRAGLANLAETPDEQNRLDILHGVEAQALRLSRLTTDLRKLAELETRPLEYSPVNLAEILEEALALASERHAHGGQQSTLIIPQAPWPLPIISGDWDLLFLALHNLLDNAFKFTQAGDKIEIRAFEDEDMLVIEVADTGPGIPEAEVPHVWEELYRGKGARGISGSGLGLALVSAIIERHHGEINLRSRAKQGTVVSVKLPQKDKSP